MKTLITLLFLFLTSILWAQNFEAGIKAGVSSTTQVALSANDLLDPTQPQSFDPSISLHFGVYGSLAFGKWTVQPEVLYVPRSSTLNYINRSVEQNLRYLDIPVILKKRLLGGLNLQVGPQVGFLISAQAEGVDIKDNFNQVDLSGVAGLGWDSPIGLKASLRFIFSLGDINEDPILGNVYGDLRNRMLQFSLSYPILKR